MSVFRLVAILIGFFGAGVAQAQTPADAGMQTNTGHAVILATQRNHHVRIFDADSLMPLGSLVVNNLASGTVATPDGQTLFVAASQTKDGNVCCSMFAVRLTENTMCPLIFPTQQATILPNGERMFLQRGNTGIDAFDTHSLAHLTGIRAPGVYHLLPSPDSRWMFGITSFQTPSLDIFSMAESRMVRRLPLDALPWDGAWLGQKFFLFTYDGTKGQVWPVVPEETEKGPKFCKQTGTCAGRPVEMPNLESNGKPVGMRVVAGTDTLFVYEPLGWWFKLDRRDNVRKPFPGGIYKIDPVGGKVLAHFTPEIDFAQVIAEPQGAHLFGLDAGRAFADNRVRLLKLDAATGQVLLSKALPTDVWSITFARIPSALIPREEAQPRLCGSQSQ